LNFFLGSPYYFNDGESSILHQINNLSRNLQGDDSEVPVIPSVGEEVASKGTRKAFLKGPGLDERYSKVSDLC
jgi:hypothetical protein